MNPSDQRRNQDDASSDGRSSQHRDSRTGSQQDRDDKWQSDASTNPKYPPKESPSSSKTKNRPIDDPHEMAGDNNLTVQLVMKLKENLMKIKKPKGTTDEQFIEEMVADIRKKEILPNSNDDAWDEDLRRYVQKCPGGFLDISRAYGDDLEHVGEILKAKMNSPTVASDTDEDDTPAETSLDKRGIAALKGLKSLENRKPSTLFRTILAMDDKDIDRADRMFYSQARSLTRDDTYTYQNAHDQVQAILFMRHEIEDDYELRRFINDHRNFDDAHEYLRKLARDRIRQSETNTTSRERFSGSQNSFGGADRGNPALTNSYASGNVPSLSRADEGHTSSNYRGQGQPSMEQHQKRTRSGATYDRQDKYSDNL